MSDVTITGLALTGRCLRSHGEDIAYLALSEITDRNRSVGAARVDFSAVGLGPWLKRGVGDDEEDEPEDEDEADGPEDDDGPDLSDALAEGIVETSLLAVAAERWIAETVTALMAGRTHGKFKIGLWSPGGKTLLHSSRFEAKNPTGRRTEADEEAEVEAERAPPVTKAPDLAPTVHAPPPRVGPTMPEERVWHALGDGYTQLISLTQSTYSHIAKLQAAEIQSLSAQNKRLHDTLEAVSGDLRKVHIGTAEAQRDEVNEAASAKVREELGKQFIAEIGSLGRTLAASKFGIPPELSELVDTIAASPDLLETLKLPAVREMLKDEATRAELVQVLRFAAKASGERAAPPPASAPDPAASAPTGASEGGSRAA